MNVSRSSVFFIFVLFGYFVCVSGNAALIRPTARGMMWIKGNHSPTNYNYMGLNCGGLKKIRQYDGQCGLCGDPYDGPRDHEFGGKYTTSAISRTYGRGQKIMEVKLLVNAFNKGHFEFRLCTDGPERLTQQCFDQHRLKIKQGKKQGDDNIFRLSRAGLITLQVEIPENVSCKRCVLQWKYIKGNAWGRDETGRPCMGCGHQEMFINCADISIQGWTSTTQPELTPRAKEASKAVDTSSQDDSSSQFESQTAIPQPPEPQINVTYTQEDHHPRIPPPPPFQYFADQREHDKSIPSLSIEQLHNTTDKLYKISAKPDPPIARTDNGDLGKAFKYTYIRDGHNHHNPLLSDRKNTKLDIVETVSGKHTTSSGSFSVAADNPLGNVNEGISNIEISRQKQFHEAKPTLISKDKAHRFSDMPISQRGEVLKQTWNGKNSQVASLEYEMNPKQINKSQTTDNKIIQHILGEPVAKSSPERHHRKTLTGSEVNYNTQELAVSDTTTINTAKKAAFQKDTRALESSLSNPMKKSPVTTYTKAINEDVQSVIHATNSSDAYIQENKNTIDISNAKSKVSELAPTGSKTYLGHDGLLHIAEKELNLIDELHALAKEHKTLSVAESSLANTNKDQKISQNNLKASEGLMHEGHQHIVEAPTSLVKENVASTAKSSTLTESRSSHAEQIPMVDNTISKGKDTSSSPLQLSASDRSQIFALLDTTFNNIDITSLPRLPDLSQTSKLSASDRAALFLEMTVVDPFAETSYPPEPSSTVNLQSASDKSLGEKQISSVNAVETKQTNETITGTSAHGNHPHMSELKQKVNFETSKVGTPDAVQTDFAPKYDFMVDNSKASKVDVGQILNIEGTSVNNIPQVMQSDKTNFSKLSLHTEPTLEIKLHSLSNFDQNGEKTAYNQANTRTNLMKTNEHMFKQIGQNEMTSSTDAQQEISTSNAKLNGDKSHTHVMDESIHMHDHKLNTISPSDVNSVQTPSSKTQHENLIKGRNNVTTITEENSDWGRPLSSADVLMKSATISKLLKAQEMVNYAHDHITTNETHALLLDVTNNISDVTIQQLKVKDMNEPHAAFNVGKNLMDTQMMVGHVHDHAYLPDFKRKETLSNISTEQNKISIPTGSQQKEISIGGIPNGDQTSGSRYIHNGLTKLEYQTTNSNISNKIGIQNQVLKSMPTSKPLIIKHLEDGMLHGPPEIYSSAEIRLNKNRHGINDTFLHSESHAPESKLTMYDHIPTKLINEKITEDKFIHTPSSSLEVPLASHQQQLDYGSSDMSVKHTEPLIKTLLPVVGRKDSTSQHQTLTKENHILQEHRLSSGDHGLSSDQKYAHTNDFETRAPNKITSLNKSSLNNLTLTSFESANVDQSAKSKPKPASPGKKHRQKNSQGMTKEAPLYPNALGEPSSQLNGQDRLNIDQTEHIKMTKTNMDKEADIVITKGRHQEIQSVGRPSANTSNALKESFPQLETSKGNKESISHDIMQMADAQVYHDHHLPNVLQPLHNTAHDINNPLELTHSADQHYLHQKTDLPSNITGSKLDTKPPDVNVNQQFHEIPSHEMNVNEHVHKAKEIQTSRIIANAKQEQYIPELSPVKSASKQDSISHNIVKHKQETNLHDHRIHNLQPEISLTMQDLPITKPKEMNLHQETNGIRDTSPSLRGADMLNSKSKHDMGFGQSNDAHVHSHSSPKRSSHELFDPIRHSGNHPQSEFAKSGSGRIINSHGHSLSDPSLESIHLSHDHSHDGNPVTFSKQSSDIPVHSNHASAHESFDKTHHSGNHPQSTITFSDPGQSDGGQVHSHMSPSSSQHAAFDPILHSGNHPQSALAKLRKQNQKDNNLHIDRHHRLHNFIAEADQMDQIGQPNEGPSSLLHGHTELHSHGHLPSHQDKVVRNRFEGHQSTSEQTTHQTSQGNSASPPNADSVPNLMESNKHPNALLASDHMLGDLAGLPKDLTVSSKDHANAIHEHSALPQDHSIEQDPKVTSSQDHPTLWTHDHMVSTSDHSSSSSDHAGSPHVHIFPPHDHHSSTQPGTHDRHWTNTLQKTTIDGFVHRITNRMESQVNKTVIAGHDTHIKVLPLSKETIMQVLQAIASGGNQMSTVLSSDMNQPLTGTVQAAAVESKDNMQSRSKQHATPNSDVMFHDISHNEPPPEQNEVVVKTHLRPQEGSLTDTVESLKEQTRNEKFRSQVSMQETPGSAMKPTVLDLSSVESGKGSFRQHISNQLGRDVTDTFPKEDVNRSIETSISMTRNSQSQETLLPEYPAGPVESVSNIQNKPDSNLSKSSSQNLLEERIASLWRKPHTGRSQLVPDNERRLPDRSASVINEISSQKMQHRSFTPSGQKPPLSQQSRASVKQQGRSPLTSRSRFEGTLERSNNFRTDINSRASSDRRQRTRPRSNITPSENPNNPFQWTNGQITMRGFRGVPFSPRQTFINKGLPGDRIRRIQQRQRPERMPFIGRQITPPVQTSPLTEHWRRPSNQRVRSGNQLISGTRTQNHHRHDFERSRFPTDSSVRKSSVRSSSRHGMKLASNKDSNRIPSRERMSDQFLGSGNPPRRGLDTIQRLDPKAVENGRGRVMFVGSPEGAQHVISDSDLGRGNEALRTMRRLIIQSEQMSAARGDPRRRIVVLPLNRKTVSRIFGDIGSRRQK